MVRKVLGIGLGFGAGVIASAVSIYSGMPQPGVYVLSGIVTFGTVTLVLRHR